MSTLKRGLSRRSPTVNSTLTNTTASDDDVISSEDTSETTNLLLERLQAWKHMCGYLEDYVDATAKVQKSQAKEYDKLVKGISKPLKEGHHFDQNVGGIAGLFENLQNNTQGMSNLFIETEKGLKGSVSPALEHLHKEIKNKAKELKSGAGKSSKAVDKARAVTQKHIELLAQCAAAYDSAAANRIDPSHDPYILRRGVNHRLNKQITEENNNRQDIISLQNSFQQFEAHVIRTVQNALGEFYQFLSSQTDRQRAIYGNILSSAQNIPLDYEWTRFVRRNNTILIDPDLPARSISDISFPNRDHKSTTPLIEGNLERKSRAVIKGYNTGYYVVTPAHYLHEFKDTDDFRRDPAPELSLYLPDCTVGTPDNVKFNVKGKDVSGGKVGNVLHMTTELSFKAPTSADARKWWSVISGAATPSRVKEVSPVSATDAGKAFFSKETSVVDPSTSNEKGSILHAETPAYGSTEKTAGEFI